MNTSNYRVDYSRISSVWSNTISAEELEDPEESRTDDDYFRREIGGCKLLDGFVTVLEGLRFHCSRREVVIVSS